MFFQNFCPRHGRVASRVESGLPQNFQVSRNRHTSIQRIQPFPTDFIFLINGVKRGPGGGGGVVGCDATLKIYKINFIDHAHRIQSIWVVVHFCPGGTPVPIGGAMIRGHTSLTRPKLYTSRKSTILDVSYRVNYHLHFFCSDRTPLHYLRCGHRGVSWSKL